MTNNTSKLAPSNDDTKIENIQELKQEVKVIALSQNNDNAFDKAVLYDDFVRAKDRSSARLYTSFSNLINVSAWVAAFFAILLIIWWGVLGWQVTYGEYSADEIMRLNALIEKLEGIFSYILTTALGFAGGVCKVFLNFNNKN